MNTCKQIAFMPHFDFALMAYEGFKPRYLSYYWVSRITHDYALCLKGVLWFFQSSFFLNYSLAN